MTQDAGLLAAAGSTAALIAARGPGTTPTPATSGTGPSAAASAPATQVVAQPATSVPGVYYAMATEGAKPAVLRWQDGASARAWAIDQGEDRCPSNSVAVSPDRQGDPGRQGRGPVSGELPLSGTHRRPTILFHVKH